MKPPDIAKARGITGWMTDRELTWLAEQASTRSLIIEIGSYMGRSTRALADHCPGTVIAVDKWAFYQRRWKNHAAIAEFRRNLADHLATGKVVMVKGSTPEVWRAIDLAVADYAQHPDMIFIDGDHRYNAVASDCVEAFKRLATGGLLCGHDYGAATCPAVKPAVDITFGGLPILTPADTIFALEPFSVQV